MILRVDGISRRTHLSWSINHLHMTATGFMGIQKLLYTSTSRLVVVLPGLRTRRPSSLAVQSWAFLTVQLNYYIKILLCHLQPLVTVLLFICLVIFIFHDTSSMRFNLHLTVYSYHAHHYPSTSGCCRDQSLLRRS